MGIQYVWNTEKNILLQETRGISFEEALYKIEHGGLIDIIDNPNKAQYPHEQAFVVSINNYTHIVPFTKKDKIIILKTIFPDRRYHKLYFPKQ